MLTFTLPEGHKIAVNPLWVETVSVRQGQTLISVPKGGWKVTEDFDDVVRQLRGALITREVHS